MLVPPVDFPEVQAAVYGVALAVDSFLLNGIQYGVLHQLAEGFVEHAASSLPRELDGLEEQVRRTPATDLGEVTELLAALRGTCQRLVELVTGLKPFRTLPREEVRAAVRQIPILRATCVQLIQRLEDCLRTPKPFYQSRPQESIAAVDSFLDHLEGAFLQEWDVASTSPTVSRR